MLTDANPVHLLPRASFALSILLFEHEVEMASVGVKVLVRINGA